MTQVSTAVHDPLVIFVMGAQHSGTTILYKMIALHPDVTWFSQFSKRDGSIPGRFRFPGYRLLDHILRRRFRHSWLKEEGPSLQSFWFPGLERLTAFGSICSYIFRPLKSSIAEFGRS